MAQSLDPLLARRDLLKAGALVVGFSFTGLPAAVAQSAIYRSFLPLFKIGTPPAKLRSTRLGR